MQLKFSILTIIFFYNLSLFCQNKTTLSGFVYDKSTGEILIGATIYDKNTNKGTVSNEYGFYSLTTSLRDSIKLNVSFLGYKSLNIKIASDRKQQTNLYLEPDTEILDEVTITTTHEDNIVKRNELGAVRLQVEDIKSLPNLFGEVDIMQAYQLTPGVQSGGEAKSNIYVRGGSPDQNLILLDDVPLYYVAHFGGFFSIFNADAIKDVNLIKGGFPARYGSRLSSILDIRMKEGNMQEFQTQGTLGLLSSKVSVEGPISKNKQSFIFSARKNLLPIFKLMGTGLSYDFYDINAKLNYRVSSKDKLFLSFYRGDDVLSMENKTEVSEHENSVKWGNTLVSFRWNHVYNDKLFSNLTLSNTYYRYKNIFDYTIGYNSTSRNINNSLLTGINDLILKIDYTYLINPNISLRFGGSSIYHTFIPNDEQFSQEGSNIPSINEEYESRATAFENAVYVENELNFSPFSANIGARYSSYHIGSKDYFSFEPRVLLNLILRDDFSLKYAYSQMNQYVHLLSYSGTGMPSDYWMPTNENIKPQESVQNSFGIAKTFVDGKYELSIEAYHKKLKNLITFTPGESLMGNLQSWENVVEDSGKGLNYGIELFFQKVMGRTTGWIGFTASRAERTFENINNNQPYPFKYDRLLDFSIVASHKLSENIILSATWTYGTGYPITLAKESYNIEDEVVFIYGEKNSFRMRDYHRLDIAVNFPRETSWGERNWTISIFNLYNRQNPYYYYYDRKLLYDEVTIDNGYRISHEFDDMKLYQRSLFSILPSFSYSFKF